MNPSQPDQDPGSTSPSGTGGSSELTPVEALEPKGDSRLRPPDPNQNGAGNPRAVRWFAWVVLIMIGGVILVAVVAGIASALGAALDSGKLLGLVAIVLVTVLFLCVKAAFHPTCGRTDERQSWREQFPAHSEQEVQRFLQVVVGGLDLRERHLSRFRPDDRVNDLDPSWGMDIEWLIMALEKEYALELPDSFLEQARTLDDLFDYVTRHSAGRPPLPSSKRPSKAESS